MMQDLLFLSLWLSLWVIAIRSKLGQLLCRKGGANLAQLLPVHFSGCCQWKLRYGKVHLRHHVLWQTLNQQLIQIGWEDDSHFQVTVRSLLDECMAWLFA